MKRSDLLLCLAVFLVALLLRFYALDYPGSRWMDEAGHVPAARNYVSSGHFQPDNWEHPPMRHFILYAFLKTLGDNPYGWRMRNVVFGAGAAALTFLFARGVSGNRQIGFFSGMLLATDPLHIVLSRYTYDEIFTAALFLASVVLYLYRERRGSAVLVSALCLGFSIAAKWYYIPCWIMMIALALNDEKSRDDAEGAFFVASAYTFIPAAVYLLAYYPWFGRGYSLSEFVEFTVNAYRSMQNYDLVAYDPNLFFLTHRWPWEWFVRPVIVGQGTLIGAEKGEFILYANNLPIWILTIPSVVLSAIIAVKRRSVRLALPAGFFAAAYSLYLVVSRPAFIYSAATLLPFAFTAIAFALWHCAKHVGTRVYFVTLALILAWCLYLYPFVTAKKVSMDYYSYLLRVADVKIFQ